MGASQHSGHAERKTLQLLEKPRVYNDSALCDSCFCGVFDEAIMKNDGAVMTPIGPLFPVQPCMGHMVLPLVTLLQYVDLYITFFTSYCSFVDLYYLYTLCYFFFLFSLVNDYFISVFLLLIYIYI